MRLFISYSSSRHELCDRLRLALEAEGHIVFADRADLRAGEGYHETLREAIQGAECFIFLISPEAVEPGSYTLAELSIAEQQWRQPAGHVLPVVIAPTAMASIPPYLRAVTLLQPQGDIVAETVAAVARMRPRRRGLKLALAAILAIVLAAAGALVLQQHEAERRAELEAQQAAAQARRQQAQRVAEAAASALQLCEAGDYALGWQRLATLDAPREREQCGMRWLRAAQVTVGKQTFGELADRIKPVLADGLPASTGAYAADLRAHLGWADFLRSRDGVAAPDPAAQYERALQDDPGNPYAHAMWGHWLLWQSPLSADAAARHFASALKERRDTAFVRSLQLAAYYNRPTLWPRLLPVLDQMRHRGERLPGDLRDRLYRNVLAGGLIDPSSRGATLAALPPADLLETFDWLQPPQRSQSEQWQADFCRALLQANAGERSTARAGLEALRRNLRSEHASGRIVDETERLLKSLVTAPG